MVFAFTWTIAEGPSQPTSISRILSAPDVITTTKGATARSVTAKQINSFGRLSAVHLGCNLALHFSGKGFAGRAQNSPTNSLSNSIFDSALGPSVA